MSVSPRSIFNGPANEWSITTYMGDLLEEAENSFGARIADYTPIGVTLRPDGPNQVLPLVGTNKRYIVLHSKFEFDLDGAIFPLSHEVIHLLAPVAKANCLEEGLATYFSVSNHHVRHDAAKVASHRKYLEDEAPLYYAALRRYERFAELGGDIKALRIHEPYISKITPELIRLCAPACDSRLISELLGFIDDLEMID